MTEQEKTKRNELIQISIYKSSMGIAMTALAIVAVLEIAMLVYTIVNKELYGPFIWRYRAFYISLLAVSLIYMVVLSHVRKDVDRRYKVLRVANPICAVFFFAWSLVVTFSDGVYTGVVDPTVFMTFSLIVPMSFYLFPPVYAVIVVAANALMLYITATISGSVGPIINLTIFFIIQFVLGISFLRLRMKLAERIVEERMNAEIDVMTGIPNRRVYEEDLKKLQEEAMPEDLVYVTMDINGLKTVNDTIGHEAGDRLIIGAAQCIRECFGAKGKLYRIGGDEFVAIITAEQEELDGLFTAFDRCAEEWSARNELTLSTSYGHACRAEAPDSGITELARTADKRMNDAKVRYYQNAGRDRRRHMPEETGL